MIFLQVVPNHAQTAPLPLPADGIWQMHWFSMGGPLQGTFAYQLSGEFNINDTLYFGVEEFDYCGEYLPSIEFYMREDSGKWYHRESITSPEYLLFDFNLQVGDEFVLPSAYSEEEYQITLEVTSIEEITMYDGSTRQKITLMAEENSYIGNMPVVWIEGIGDESLGIINCWANTCIDLNISMRCFFRNEEKIYPLYEFPLGQDCCILTNVSEIEHQDVIDVYPNPTSNSCAISSNSPIYSVSISDLHSTDYKKFTEINQTTLQLDVSTLASGVYIMRIKTESGYQHKLMVKE